MNKIDFNNNIKSNSLLINNKIQKICILYIALWSIAPPLQIGTIYRLLSLLCAAVWFCFELKKGIEISKIQIYYLLLLVAVVIVTVFKRGFSEILSPIALYMLLLFSIINAYYKNRWHELQNLHIILLIIFTVLNIITYKEILINPQITRSLVRDTEELYVYYKKGVGGYALIYSQICIFAVGVQWTISCFKKSKIQFAIGVAWIISLTLVVFKAGYSIAIFTYVASLIILIFYNRKNSMLAIAISISILFIFLYSIVKFPWLQTFLLNTFEGTTVTKKIHDLIDSARDGTVEGSIYVRVNAYLSSLKTFFENPFIGCLWQPKAGGHSAIIDMFANYGILGGIIYTKMLVFGQFKRFKEIENKRINHAVNACIVAIMLVATLDTITYQFIVPIFIMVPLFLYNISNEKRDTDNESTLDCKFNTL